MSTDSQATETVQPPRWRPLSAKERRVLGVLVEKAKTTPDGYPMSLNALRGGCNQKNNRYPLMDLELEDVEESLTQLRAAGAIGEVQGGRVPRYRHYMYEWLGVEKLELAVMAELLLRGAQTEGELRGRAARMDPIPDLAVLRPVLESLKQKGLVIPLTPEGRGHVLTHALYEERELEKLRAEFAGSQTAEMDTSSAGSRAGPRDEPPRHVATSSGAARGDHSTEVDTLRHQMEELRAELDQLRQEVDELRTSAR